MRHPSRSNAATLDEALGVRLTPWRHVWLGPRAGSSQRKVWFWFCAASDGDGFVKMEATGCVISRGERVEWMYARTFDCLARRAAARVRDVLCLAFS